MQRIGIECWKKNNQGENYFVKRRNNPRFNNKNKGKGKQFVQNKPVNRNNTNSRRCFYCNKEGHIKKNCYEFKRKLKEKEGIGDNNVTVTDGQLGINEVLMVSSNARDKEWILDSGCTFHMSPNKN